MNRRWCVHQAGERRPNSRHPAADPGGEEKLADELPTERVASAAHKGEQPSPILASWGRSGKPRLIS